MSEGWPVPGQGAPRPEAGGEAGDEPEAMPAPGAADRAVTTSTGEPEEAAGAVTAAAPVARRATPPIPAAALSERNAQARSKGLPGLVIQGGDDPFPQVGRAEERRYLRLLLAMVALIVLAGFVLGLAGLVVGGPAAS